MFTDVSQANPMKGLIMFCKWMAVLITHHPLTLHTTSSSSPYNTYVSLTKTFPFLSLEKTMASLQSFAISSPISHYSPQPYSHPGCPVYSFIPFLCYINALSPCNFLVLISCDWMKKTCLSEICWKIVIDVTMFWDHFLSPQILLRSLW